MLLKYKRQISSQIYCFGNNFIRNILSKIKSTSLLLIILISTITTLPILNSTNAEAATNTYSANKSDQDWVIKSILYYRTIKLCLNDSSLSSGNLFSGRYITYNNAKNYKWFGGGPLGGVPSIGVYMKDSTIQNGEYGDIIKSANWDGFVWCNNQYLVQDALAFWSLDPITVLCESGFSRDKNGTKDKIGTVESCESAEDNQQGALNFATNSNVSTKFTSYIKKTIYGDEKTEPSLNITGTTTSDKQEQAARWYRFYRHSLNESCIPNIDSVPPVTNSGLSGPNVYSGVIWVNKDTGEITKGTYTGALSASDKANIGSIPDEFYFGGENLMKCSDIVKEMNKNANLYSAWVIAYVKEHQTAPPAPITEPTAKQPTSSCVLKGMGWIVCPVMYFISSIADESYKLVQEMMITPNLNIDTSSNNNLYTAWGLMRSIANIAFVIAFLIIIFSQLTSFGITNYGVKKMLPRLVIAVILVNVSYFLCAILVDISNIGGVSFKQLFDSISGQIAAPVIKGGTGWVTIVGGVLGGAYLLYAGLAVLIPALTAAVLAIVTVFLVLTLRQALIILLIVVSPIAFVAFLLPNTEDLFKKWRSLFTTLLLMFPIISIIFGASALASKVVMNSGTDTTVQIMGGLVAVIPLFLTPIIMKSAGGLLGKVGGIITNSGVIKGVSGAANKYSEDYQKRRNTRLNNEAINAPGGRNPFRRFRRASIERTARIEAIDQNQQRELARSRTEYIADATAANTQSATQRALSAISGGRIGGQGLRDQMAIGGSEGAEIRARVGASTTLSKLESEDLNNATALLNEEVSAQRAAGNNDIDTFLEQRAVSANHSALERNAAVNSLAAGGRDSALRRISSGTVTVPAGTTAVPVDQAALQRAIASNASALSNKAPDIVRGGDAAFNSVTGAQLAGFSSGTAEAYMHHLERLRSTGNPNYAKAVESFNNAVVDITRDTSLQGKFEGEVGLKIASTVPVGSALQSDLTLGLSEIGNDGKIR